MDRKSGERRIIKLFLHILMCISDSGGLLPDLNESNSYLQDILILSRILLSEPLWKYRSDFIPIINVSVRIALPIGDSNAHHVSQVVQESDILAVVRFPGLVRVLSLGRTCTVSHNDGTFKFFVFCLAVVAVAAAADEDNEDAFQHTG